MDFTGAKIWFAPSLVCIEFSTFFYHLNYLEIQYRFPGFLNACICVFSMNFIYLLNCFMLLLFCFGEIAF